MILYSLPPYDMDFKNKSKLLNWISFIIFSIIVKNYHMQRYKFYLTYNNFHITFVSLHCLSGQNLLLV